MTQTAKAAAYAVVPVAVLSPMGFMVSSLTTLAGPAMWMVRIAFVLLGLLAAAAVFWFVKRDKKGDSGPPLEGASDPHIDGVIAEARRRLASARGAGRAKFGELPLILVTGPTGGTKTTSIIRSGLEPELLAGEVRQGDTVIPTKGANVWFSNGALWVEAGGAVLQDNARWSRLVRLLHPRRLGAIFRGGGQAPRLAVLCVSCEELLGAGTVDQVQGLARTLRTRLVETARDFGIRLPVYVVFTKADRIRHFEEFVLNFTHDETRRVLGATLPVGEPLGAGSYAETQFAQLNRAFDRLFHSLASKRLKFLPRDSDVDRATRAYEFPREFSKLQENALGFLVELCRPSELEVSPFLRGFYFTGVRPLTVAGGGVVAPQRAAPSGPVDATMVFDAAVVQRAMAERQASQGPSRRIPQWVFLERALKDVILEDSVAQEIAGGGSQVTTWRRRLLATAAVLTLLFMGGQTISWLNNRSLKSEVARASQGLDALVTDEALPAAPPVLARLDTLRTHLVQLREWERDGPPLFHRFGLYSGSSLHEVARAEYFRAFDQILFNRTSSELSRSISQLPDTPSVDDDYDAAYDDLKAYLITTLHADRSTPEFLAPALLSKWRGMSTVEDERLEVARRQFDYFAEELAISNPFPDRQADGALVSQARRFLLEFGQAEPFMRALVADANSVGPSVRLPGGVISDSVVVGAAFTRAGWEFVRTRISNPDSLLKTEEWVLGEGAAAPDPTALVQALDSMYQEEFAERWQSFVASANVAPFSDEADAGARLARLADPDSPLAELILVTSENTAPTSPVLRRIFEPIYALAPPDSSGSVALAEPTRRYLSSLGAVAASMTALAAVPPEEKAPALQATRAQIMTAKQTTVDVAQGFASRTQEARPLATELRELLDQPLMETERVLGVVQSQLESVPVAELNDRGVTFCREFERLNAFFPFRRDPSARDASLEDVAAALQPESSALWNLYQQSLQGILERRGSRYVARPDAQINVLPSFLDFFNRAAAISGTLYAQGAERPGLDVSFRPRFTDRLEDLTMIVDGTSTNFTPVSNRTTVLNWDGQPSEIRLLGRVDGVQRTLLGPVSGSWALFRFLLAAEDWTSDGSRYRVEWSIPVSGAADLKLTADVEAPPALAGGDFSELRCPGRIAER